MEHFTRQITVSRSKTTTSVRVVSSDKKTAILSIADVEVNYEQFLYVKDRKEVQAIIDTLTSFIQYVNGQQSIL